MIIFRRILLWIIDWDKSCIENQNTYFMFKIFFPRRACLFWRNEGKHRRTRRATDDNIIWRMRFACWTNKAIHRHTLRICNIYCFWLHERASLVFDNMTSYYSSVIRSGVFPFCLPFKNIYIFLIIHAWYISAHLILRPLTIIIFFCYCSSLCYKLHLRHT